MYYEERELALPRVYLCMYFYICPKALPVRRFGAISPTGRRMLEKLISYCAKHHMLANFITAAVLLGAIFAWQKTGKEEMPNYELNYISIRTSYPGASPEDVEQLVTKRLEREIKGIDGVYSMRSTTSSGSSSITVEFIPGYSDMNGALNDIRNMIANVRLPSEVRNQPSVRQYKTTRRSVMDVAVYLTDTIILSREDRGVLQRYAYNFSEQLANLPQVSEVSTSGYYKNELQIVLDPAKLQQFNVSTSEVISALQRNNLRVPAGSLEDENNTEVSVIAELDSVEQLNSVVIRTSFDSPAVRLTDLATIRKGFNKNTWISKINGREGVTLNVRKTADSDIIKTTDSVREFVERYQRDILSNSPVEVQILNDASRDVRNRLYIVVSNGILGVALILVFLFLFMDAKSALWVATGIPVTFCITAIFFPLIGYTINNITLAGIIIVMGLIVDDAIIVSENVARHRASGKSTFDSIVVGTKEVFLPVLASIATTCAAFIPLLFFSGRYSQMIIFIPPVVLIMLMASLFETVFILPSHLGMHLPDFIKRPLERIRAAKREKVRYTSGSAALKKNAAGEKEHWFVPYEKAYARFLARVLPYRVYILVSFVLLLAFAAYLFATHLRFVLFPDEVSNEVLIYGNVIPDATRFEAEFIIRGVEEIIEQDRPNTVNAYRTSIARNRRGSVSDQTAFSINVELRHREEREKTADELVKAWRDELPIVPGIDQLLIASSRFGSSSGSTIEVEVRENDDTIRQRAAEMVRDALIKLPKLSNSEVDEPIRNPEYRINLNRELVSRLGINPSGIASALRTILEGTIVAELNGGDEEVDLRVSITEDNKQSVYNLLQNFVENNGSYLVPITQLVNYERALKPASITRILQKRTTMVYASPEDENSTQPQRRSRQTKTNAAAETPAEVMRDTNAQGAEAERGIARETIAIEEKTKQEEMTPIEIAAYLEREVFPEIHKLYPSVVFGFSGEIKDTRESSGDFAVASILALFFIFIILALVFGSILRPIIVMLTIPFGLVGVIITFWLHGIIFFGLFAAIGALGLAGVVINDSIVMLDKLDRTIPPDAKGKERYRLIAEAASTRFRAVLLTTVTTVVAIMPTAYGFFGYDAMLTQMMLAISWGLIFGTLITLIFIPCTYTFLKPPAAKKKEKPLPISTWDQDALAIESAAAYGRGLAMDGPPDFGGTLALERAPAPRRAASSERAPAMKRTSGLEKAANTKKTPAPKTKPTERINKDSLPQNKSARASSASSKADAAPISRTARGAKK